jgi:hypothetical protein
MKQITEGLRAIWGQNKLVVGMMVLELLVGLTLAISALLSLAPAGLVANIGYGDIGGYREGGWYYYVAFAIVGLVIGVGHNLIAVRMFEEKDGGTVVAFLMAGLVAGVMGTLALAGLAGGVI